MANGEGEEMGRSMENGKVYGEWGKDRLPSVLSVFSKERVG
jgi:hypothetical protein